MGGRASLVSKLLVPPLVFSFFSSWLDLRASCLAWRTLALDQTNAWCGKRLVTAPPPRSTRRAKQNTELRRHDRLDKSNPWINQSGSAVLAAGRPFERIFEYRYEELIHQGVSESNTRTGTE